MKGPLKTPSSQTFTIPKPKTDPHKKKLVLVPLEVLIDIGFNNATKEIVVRFNPFLHYFIEHTLKSLTKYSELEFAIFVERGNLATNSQGIYTLRLQDENQMINEIINNLNLDLEGFHAIMQPAPCKMTKIFFYQSQQDKFEFDFHCVDIAAIQNHKAIKEHQQKDYEKVLLLSKHAQQRQWFAQNYKFQTIPIRGMGELDRRDIETLQGALKGDHDLSLTLLLDVDDTTMHHDVTLVSETLLQKTAPCINQNVVKCIKDDFSRTDFPNQSYHILTARPEPKTYLQNMEQQKQKLEQKSAAKDKKQTKSVLKFFKKKQSKDHSTGIEKYKSYIADAKKLVEQPLAVAWSTESVVEAFKKQGINITISEYSYTSEGQTHLFKLQMIHKMVLALKTTGIVCLMDDSLDHCLSIIHYGFVHQVLAKVIKEKGAVSNQEHYVTVQKLIKDYYERRSEPVIPLDKKKYSMFVDMFKDMLQKMPNIVEITFANIMVYRNNELPLTAKTSFLTFMDEVNEEKVDTLDSSSAPAFT